MDYEKHYNNLIEKAQHRVLDTYTERHHILPKCLGGDDTKENIVILTPEEHYVAHQLLVKMYPKNQKLVYALNKMTQGRPSNKRYGWVRQRWQEVCKQRIGKLNGSYDKSWYYNPETLENGKFLPEDVPSGWVKGRRTVPYNRCRVCGTKIESRYNKTCSTECLLSVKKETGNAKKFAEETFNRFMNSNYTSVTQFAKAMGMTQPRLCQLWKRHIPEYSDNRKHGKPFKRASSLAG